MELEKFFVLAAIVLGIVTLAVGSLLATQGTLSFYQPSSSPANETLLNLTGQNLAADRSQHFPIPLIVRPSAKITINLQSSAPLDVSIYDANGPLTASAASQTSYTITITPSYDTVATIQVTNNSGTPSTFTLTATETYTTLTPQASQVDTYAGYLGLAAGVGLLLLGLAVLLRRNNPMKSTGMTK